MNSRKEKKFNIVGDWIMYAVSLASVILACYMVVNYHDVCKTTLHELAMASSTACTCDISTPCK